ncbi:MAG: hypothetical protein VB049_09370 [Candidatus Pelethousia sp.]|nr:hypothetical protein [Candidatus Pelethousia sp.]
MFFGLPWDTAWFLWFIPLLLVIGQFLYCWWDDKREAQNGNTK